MYIMCNLPLIMSIAFLGITLIVGLYYSRTIISFKEYAIGHKKFSTSALVMTILANQYDGVLFEAAAQHATRFGLYTLVLILLSASNLWVISFLSKRMSPFMHHFSIVETIGSVYGRSCRMIVCIAYIVYIIGSIGSCIHFMIKTLNICIPESNFTTYVMVVTLIIIFYSTFGGIRAVTFTDILQFIVFSTIIPLLCWTSFININKPLSEIILLIQKHKQFQISNICYWENMPTLKKCLKFTLDCLVIDKAVTSMQRVYMSSSPSQAKKAFADAFVFSICILLLAFLMHIFVFVHEPNISIKGTYPYFIETLSPFFKGLFAISILALGMSTADSFLNIGSIIISHDLIGGVFGKKLRNPLRIARWASIAIGLLSMVLSYALFYGHKNKYGWKIAMTLMRDCTESIALAPLLLAIFGFRSSSRTILIGMTTGCVTTFIWDVWYYPASVLSCIIANGLAILTAHYALPQPAGTGWITNEQLFRNRQTAARRNIHTKTGLNKIWSKKKLAQLLTDSKYLYLFTGSYISANLLFSFFFLEHHTHWLWYISQSFVGLVGVWGMLVKTKHNDKPSTRCWQTGIYWLTVICFCLPIHLIFCWLHATNLLVLSALSVTNLIVLFYILPNFIASMMIGTTLICLIYPIVRIVLSANIAAIAIPLFGILLLGIWFFILLLYHKKQYNFTLKKRSYLQKQYEQIHNLAHCRSTQSELLDHIVYTVTDTIAFPKNVDLFYKKDFQAIINSFKEWGHFLKRCEQQKASSLLSFKMITTTRLVCELEEALAIELPMLPTLVIEQNQTFPGIIYCDTTAIIRILVYAVIRILDLQPIEEQLINIAFHKSCLSFYKTYSDDADNMCATYDAVAIVIYNRLAKHIPTIQSVYKETIRTKKATKKEGDYDFKKHEMHTIVEAHYGQIECYSDKAISMILPMNATEIQQEIVEKLPKNLLLIEKYTTKKEIADAMMALMEFHDEMMQIKGVDSNTIGGILLLLRRCYKNMKHASDVLYYIRVIHIAKKISIWLYHSPNLIYAALLYDLVRYTKLPLSYIDSNFGKAIAGFVEKLIALESEIKHTNTVFYTENQIKKNGQQEHISTIFIKFSERIYDLSHAHGYITNNKKESLKFLIAETKTIYLPLAKQFFYAAEHGIIDELAEMLKYAQKVYKKNQETS